MVALTVPVGEAKAGETTQEENHPKRHKRWKSPTDSKATTLVDFFEECVKRQGKRNAMGWREFIDTHFETKKVTKKVDGKDTQVNKNWVYYEYAKYGTFTTRTC